MLLITTVLVLVSSTSHGEFRYRLPKKVISLPAQTNTIMGTHGEVFTTMCLHSLCLI